ncbi:hypothetical protein OCUBac02_32950 [Bosea sp. ANAM02]|nr:hypothetical protein OCUBac02_32950 [Bosea sp. ANAM02]
MSHLWKQPSGWVFQFHVPKGFVERLGATPFRVRLGRLPVPEALWPAAGFVDTEIGCFMNREVGYAAKTVWA